MMIFALVDQRKTSNTRLALMPGSRVLQRCGGSVCAGFTLIEVILTLSLLVLIAGLSIGSIAFSDAGDFDEGVDRFETMLRFARTDASSQGARIRIAFEFDDDDNSLAIKLLWEPKPLEEPGVFYNYSTACTWRHNIPDNYLRIGRVSLFGDSAFRSMVTQGMGESSFEDLPDSITFMPDGSSDSAVIELLPVSQDDLRCAIIIIDGITGMVSTYEISANEADDYISAAIEGQSVSDLHEELYPEVNP